MESTNPSFGRAVVRVNVYRTHRQTVQYIQPQHHARLAQAELLVIDEAAAIPLPLVKAMLGPYLVFLCSTGGPGGAAAALELDSAWLGFLCVVWWGCEVDGWMACLGGLAAQSQA